VFTLCTFAHTIAAAFDACAAFAKNSDINSVIDAKTRALAWHAPSASRMSHTDSVKCIRMLVIAASMEAEESETASADRAR
jgi:hypothetical protein